MGKGLEEILLTGNNGPDLETGSYTDNYSIPGSLIASLDSF